jgi:hypothetical protein
MNLDFRQCKSPDDVKKVFAEHDKEIVAVSAIPHLMFPKPPKREKKAPKPLRRFKKGGQPKWLKQSTKPIKQIGKKGKIWVDARAALKKIFFGWGITTCEIRIPHDCTRDNYLGFAHVDKRKNLGHGEIMSVILACNNGHDIIEAWPATKMREYVQSIIDARTERLQKRGVKI